MTPEPTPRVRHNPSLRNALHCQGLLLFVRAGLRAYRRGPRPDDFQEDDEFPGLPNSRYRYWTYFKTRFLGMKDLAAHAPGARASAETAVDRILEYAQYKLTKIKRSEKRRKMRDASSRHRGVDGHVPLHKLMRGLRISPTGATR